MNIFPITQTASLAGQLMDPKNSTIPLIEMTSFKPRYDFEIKGTPIERCSPEQEGVPSALILDLLKKLSTDKSVKLHSITIARNGKIICEAALGAQRLDVWKHSFSACKSVTSLAVGMLIDDGLLSLDEKIINIFKDETTPIIKIKLKDLCVEDLLTMRSTVLFAEGDSMTETDWVKAFLSSPTKGTVGESFKYNSLNTYMLSAIVTKKTGKKLSEFLDERLFAPLGIKDFYWEKCPSGIDKGGWGLDIRPEDFVKIGTLVINGGVYNGQRLISEEYISMATSKHVDVKAESDRYDYGYQIWVAKNNNSFLFNGMLGQNLLGFKDNGIVVLANAGNSEMFQQGSFFEYLNEAFNREFPSEIAAAPSANKELSQYIQALSSYNKLPRKIFIWERLSAFFCRPEQGGFDFEQLNGKSFKVKSGENRAVGILPLVVQSVENCYSKGLEGLSFRVNSDGVKEMVYVEADAEYIVPLGEETPAIFNLSYRNDNFLIASSVRFTKNEDEEDVMVIKLDFLETPSTRIIKLYQADGNTLRIDQSESPGEDFMIRLSDMMMSELADKPLIGVMLDKFGADYIEYRIEKIFKTTLLLSDK